MKVRISINIDGVDIVNSFLVFGCPQSETKESVCSAILNASKKAIQENYIKMPEVSKVEKEIL